MFAIFHIHFVTSFEEKKDLYKQSTARKSRALHVCLFVKRARPDVGRWAWAATPGLHCSVGLRGRRASRKALLLRAGKVSLSTPTNSDAPSTA